MIKIITPGTRKTRTCKQCGCYFSYELEDVQEQQRALLGYQPSIKYITCPQCSEKIYFDAKEGH